MMRMGCQTMMHESPCSSGTLELAEGRRQIVIREAAYHINNSEYHSTRG